MRPPSGCWKNFARPRASMMGCDIRYYKDAQNAELDRMEKGIDPATDLEYRSHCEGWTIPTAAIQPLRSSHAELDVE